MGLFHWLSEVFDESSLHEDLYHQRELGKQDMLNHLIQIVKDVRLESKVFSIVYATSLILVIALLKYRDIDSESTEGIAWMCLFQATPYIFNIFQKNKVRGRLNSLTHEIDISADDVVAPLANAKNTIHAGLIFCIWEPLIDNHVSVWLKHLSDLFFHN